jgi:tRNA-Thr(GGU) m(6)t(6)A37 methyltransferase TsaA
MLWRRKKRAGISTIAMARCIICVGRWASADRSQSLSGDNPISDIRPKPIGVVRTGLREPKGTPIQPSMAGGARGTVTVCEEFQDRLKDLQGFQCTWLICRFHLAAKARLLVTPFLDDRQRGVFAMRAPARPNPVGISPVRLLRVHGNVFRAADIDIVHGTLLLDTKPYASAFDCYKVKRSGWLHKARKSCRIADERFERAGDKR